MDLKNISLEKEEIVIKGKKLIILKPAKLEEIFKGDPFLEIGKFPFWFKLWEASFVLADYLAGLKEKKKILELGAGLGLVSLVCAANGHEVLATDYEKLPLELIKKSAEINKVSLKTQILDWRQPDLNEKFDLIVGAEIIFKKSLFPYLFDLFKKALLPKGEIVIAHSIERKRVLVPFLYEAEKEYKVLTSIRKLKEKEQVYEEIVLNRLIPKQIQNEN